MCFSLYEAEHERPEGQNDGEETNAQDREQREDDRQGKADQAGYEEYSEHSPIILLFLLF